MSIEAAIFRLQDELKTVLMLKNQSQLTNKIPSNTYY
jgi:hypothetical protein